MHKKYLSYLIIGITGVSVLLLPQSVLAAELFFTVLPNDTPNNEDVIIEARMNPQGRDINAVEGIISLQSEKSSADIPSVMIETGGSVLTLWPTLPQYLPSEKVIRFVGGVPQGFDHESPLFRLRILNASSGNITISWIGGSAYLNDGKGTTENISAHSITVSLSPHNTKNPYDISLDSTPPQFDVVEIGQDPSVYDGKYFVSFHATDDISGVTRYEVTEGQELTSVTDGVYVLKNQDQNTPILITAYDQMGNHKTIEFPSRFNSIKDDIIILLFILIFIFILIYGYKKIVKK